MSSKKKAPKPRQKTIVDKAAAIIQPYDHPSKGIPVLNRDEWLRAMRNRDYNTIYTVIVRFLLHFEQNHYKAYSFKDLEQFDQFAAMVYMTFSDEKFQLSRQQWQSLICMGHLLNSCFAMSAFQTTDPVLHAALRQQNNLPRLLMCQNARNELQIPPKEFFGLDPLLASAWFNTYILGISQATPKQLKNQYEHLQQADDRWVPINHFVTSLYFTCTYFSPDNARRVKGIVNNGIKKVLDKTGAIKVKNNPNPKSIAIVTNKWHRNHAVYKSAGPLVEQLIGHYDLTLIRTQRPDTVPDTAVTKGFKRIEHLYFTDPEGEFKAPQAYLDNDFQMIYFPDVGMTNESVWLSNVRAAPIQAMGYGHPDTSGDNSEIDYFIGGHIEEDATECYSEKMILIPGLAQEPAWPTYERKYNWQPSETVRINCVWGPDKYNWQLLSCLKEMSRLAKRPHEFHLFASPGINRYGALVPFIKEVTAFLPNAIIHSEQEYYDYMEAAEQHDFSINSFPFGGYNTIVESFYLGLPVITLKGSRFYNRAASHLLEQVGMPELSTDTPREFIELGAMLINTPDALAVYRQALADVDLKAKLFTLSGNHFLDAVNYIMANHPIKETVKIG